MRAIVQEKYGTPSVFQLKDVEKPVCKEEEVLVRVCAASVHVGDWHVMRGKPLLLRLMMGFGRPRNRPGSDVAGVVEAVGAKVTSLKPGDEVFGWCEGAFSEYACADEKNFTHKPESLSFEEAASVGVSAFTALHAVRDQAKIQPGHKVLVNGASGGVGTFTVQVAKAFGAEVTGVCSTRNVEMVASLGADHVIDYTKEDFTQNGQQYDFILDVAGSRSFSEIRRVLAPHGKLVPIGGDPSLLRILGVFLRSLYAKQQMGPFVSMPCHEDLLALKQLVDDGSIKPVIDRQYPLHETPKAFGYIGEGHARAKIVIQVAS